MFSVKSYFYGKLSSANLSGADGARVYYIDNNGVTWASYYGSGSQTNKATFSCILYNSSGSTMTLTNGICMSRTVIY